jgi:hypothetical protein
MEQCIQKCLQILGCHSKREYRRNHGSSAYPFINLCGYGEFNIILIDIRSVKLKGGDVYWPLQFTETGRSSILVLRDKSSTWFETIWEQYTMYNDRNYLVKGSIVKNYNPKDRVNSIHKGTPGVGKSWFLMYCLYRLTQMQLGRPIILSHYPVCNICICCTF